MRDYQPNKNNPYRLPRNLYMQTLYLIRDYDRLKRTYDDILYSSPDPRDGMPSSGEINDGTAEKATTRAAIAQKCEAIEQAKLQIPEEYRKAVMDNIRYQVPYPDYAAYSTWKRWRQRFIYFVAKNLNWV